MEKPCQLDTDPTISSIIADPSFLQRVSVASFDPTDSTMHTLVQRARGTSDANIRVSYRGPV